MAVVLVVLATGAALCMGPADLSPGDVWRSLTGGNAGSIEHTIVHRVRPAATSEALPPARYVLDTAGDHSVTT